MAHRDFLAHLSRNNSQLFTRRLWDHKTASEDGEVRGTTLVPAGARTG
jgi:hypothetical protein